jgi:hypothetical protein
VRALRLACPTWALWLLSAAFMVCGFHIVFIGTHLPAYLADRVRDKHSWHTWEPCVDGRMGIPP